MSEYMFGLGVGHLSRRADKIARRHGAILINYCEPGCKCGYGCNGECPACKRHWFTGPNRGEPFNSDMARAVLAWVEGRTK